MSECLAFQFLIQAFYYDGGQAYEANLNWDIVLPKQKKGIEYLQIELLASKLIQNELCMEYVFWRTYFIGVIHLFSPSSTVYP
jgi:hypothetical protein